MLLKKVRQISKVLYVQRRKYKSIYLRKDYFEQRLYIIDIF
jgi:hypothetical protein